MKKIVLKKGGKTEEWLTLQQEEFCRLYTSGDKDCRGNATQSYIQAYDVQTVVDWQFQRDVYNYAKSEWCKQLTKPNLNKRINELLDEWFTDTTVDKELSFVIKQNKELSAKVSAIKEYNRLKERVIEKAPVTMTIDVTNMSIKEIEEKRRALLG